MKEYQTRSHSKEPLLNLAVGYVVFAPEEKNLFRFLYLDQTWSISMDDLAGMRKSFIEDFGEDTPAGAGLVGISRSGKEGLIRSSWIFTHGIAMHVYAGVFGDCSNETIERFDIFKAILYGDLSIKNEEPCMQKGKASMKGYYGVTFIIGLGFFTMGLMDPLYDTYVPMFLTNYLRSDGIVGLIMGIDNLFALLLIPIVSALSDKTRTPLGRRMPYILVTLPLTAVFFGILPTAAVTSLALLVIIIFFLNVFKQAARGPVVALMPDIIPGDLRSEANGVINTMGGIAAIVGTVFLARLYDINITLPLFGNTLIPFPGSSVRGAGDASVGSLPFLISALLVMAVTLLLFLFVKEKKAATSLEGEERIPVMRSLKIIFTAKDKSALFILFSILFWFVGYQGVLPWIGIYGVEFLDLTPGTAALSAGMVGIAYAIFAIPSGIAAHRIGRKRTIRISLMVLTILTFIMYFHHPFTTALGVSRTFTLASFWAMLFLFGIFWVAVVTNSFPMLWQMATFANIGIYTGLYYFFSQGAGIIGPGIAGGVRDIFGPRIIFLSAGGYTLVAFLLMGFVKRGEPEDSSIPTETG